MAQLAPVPGAGVAGATREHTNAGFSLSAAGFRFDRLPGLAIRRGGGRAVMATAHKILRIVFAMLRDDKPYRDPQIDYQARTAIKSKARWLKMLRKANLLQEVAQQAAKQLRPAPDGVRAGPPPGAALTRASPPPPAAPSGAPP